MGNYSPNIIANSILSCAKYNAHGEIVIYGKRHITWEELKSRIFKIAQALIKLGIKKGDKVSFIFHNTPEFIELNYGIQVAGAIPSPMNYRFTSREIEYQVNHSDAKILIYDTSWSKSAEEAASKLPNVKHFICKGSSKLDKVIDYENFVNSGEDVDPAVANEWDDVAVIIYTGGTTGFPKGVMLTYRAHLDMFSTFLSSILIRLLTMDMTPKQHLRMLENIPNIPMKRLLSPILRTKSFKKIIDRPGIYKFFQRKLYRQFSNPKAARKGYKNTIKSMTPSMPFFHDAAYAGLIMAALKGNTCYVLPDSIKFNPSLILETIEREQVVNISNVPTGWKKLVSFPDAEKYNLSSVRTASTGGGPCSIELKKQIFRLFPNAMILDGFGQTEMTPLTSFRIDMGPENLKDRSVGKSIVDIKVVDENGIDLPKGEIGELLYRSSTIMKGYYKDEDTTSKVIKDGWFRSGDLGYLDEVGEIRLVDRKKECINTGGEKVFPLEVEEVIQKYPGVESVCIIGKPDEEWGNTICAVIQPKSGKQLDEKDIIKLCRSELAGYKIPRSVVFVDEIPYSPAGKMLRQKIRDLYGKAD